MPKKIISLVPSQTELLFDLGLENEIVGLTKFCIYPKEKVKSKTVIGGTKKFRFDVINQLHPDLIIGNKEENYKEGIEELSKNYKVWISDIYTFDDALDMVSTIGQLTNKEQKSKEIINSIQEGFKEIKPLQKTLKVAYLIWQNPYMAVGQNTFIHNILEKLGLENVFAGLERYPEVSLEIIKTAKPNFILLSSEPYPFKEKHLNTLQKELPQSRILLVDGEAFSWYGTRLIYSITYFKEFLTLIASSLDKQF